MTKTHDFSLQPSATIIFKAAANIYASYIVAGQITDENKAIKMEEAIESSISLAHQVESIVDSDSQLSGQARRRLSNTVREK